MKRVVVTQRVDFLHERNEWRDSLDQKLNCFVSELGAITIPVPNSLFQFGALLGWLNEIRADAFILSGGNNIGENNDRDNTEKFILDYANKKAIPVLGICRGMQMIGMWSGAELKKVTDHVSSMHQLTGEICGAANSYHQFSLNECPMGFRVLARSEDREIEAIASKTLPWEGWMWHPERNINYLERDINRLRKLFDL